MFDVIVNIFKIIMKGLDILFDILAVLFLLVIGIFVLAVINETYNYILYILKTIKDRREVKMNPPREAVNAFISPTTMDEVRRRMELLSWYRNSGVKSSQLCPGNREEFISELERRYAEESARIAKEQERRLAAEVRLAAEQRRVDAIKIESQQLSDSEQIQSTPQIIRQRTAPIMVNPTKPTLYVLIKPRVTKANRINYIVGYSTYFEFVLGKYFNAEGKGLGEKIKSVEKQLHVDISKKFWSVVAVRNKVMHEWQYTVNDIDAFAQNCNDILFALDRALVATETASTDVNIMRTNQKKSPDQKAVR